MKSKNPNIVRLEPSQERLIGGGSASNWITGLAKLTEVAFQLLSIFKVAFTEKGSITNANGKFSWDNNTSNQAVDRLRSQLGITKRMVDDYKQFKDVYSA